MMMRISLDGSVVNKLNLESSNNTKTAAANNPYLMMICIISRMDNVLQYK